MNFGNMDVCAEYVRATIVPLLQREFPNLQTVHLRGTHFVLVNFGETKTYRRVEFIGILVLVLPDINESYRGPNPTISGKLLNGDVQNPPFMFDWTLDEMVERITDFHNQ